MTDKERALQNVIGTMALEGIEMTDADIDRARAIIDGEQDAEAVVAAIRDRYLALTKVGNRKAAAS